MQVKSIYIMAGLIVMNDLIHINEDGNTASGVWRNNQPLTITDENGNKKALWMLARYDEKYINTNKPAFKRLIT